MVFEFPELQGTMGGIYAREQGLPEPVWRAIYHHYLPIGVEADAAPSKEQLGGAAVTWAAVSLADKLDTVSGLFGAGEKVTGSRDPFALRRQMHGIVRILMDLPELTGIDRELDLASLAKDAAAKNELSTFAIERVRYALEQRGFPIEVVRAATPSSTVCPAARAAYCGSAAGDARRPRIFRRWPCSSSGSRTSRASGRTTTPLDRAALTEGAERALLAELDARRPRIAQATRAADYKRAFAEIAGLRPAVDRFFTEVFVMADDARTRSARLALMAELRDLILELADISEIVPQTE